MADNNQQNDSVEVVFPYPAVINYPRLFKAEKDERTGTEKFSAMFLIDKNTEEGKATAVAILDAIRNTVRRGFVSGSGEKRDKPTFVKEQLVKTGLVKPDFDYTDNEQLKAFTAQLPLPLKDGDTERYVKGLHRGQLRRDVDEHYAGHWYIEATSKKKTPKEGEEKNEGRQRVPAIQLVNGKREPLNDKTLVSGNLCRAKLLFLPYASKDGMGVSAYLQAVVKDGEGTPFVTPRNTDPFDGFGLPEDAADPFAGLA